MLYTKEILDLCDDAVIKVSSTIIKDIMIHINLPRERIGSSVEINNNFLPEKYCHY